MKHALICITILILSGCGTTEQFKTPVPVAEELPKGFKEQFALGLPEGFEAYEGMKGQFVIGLPGGWNVLNQQEIIFGSSGGPNPFPLVFSKENFNTKAMMSGEKGAAQKMADQLARIEVGLSPGFMLDRLPAKEGMICSGFDARAKNMLLKLMGTDPMFGPGRATREKPRAEGTAIGGCQGYRIKGKGESSNGDGKILDVFAVADGNIVYFFKLLNLEEHHPKNVGTFEEIVSTLKLRVAIGG